MRRVSGCKFSTHSNHGIIFAAQSENTAYVINDLWTLELCQLERLYRIENERLHRQLLAGASWEEVADLRKQLGELSAIIYKKRNPAQFGHPAEQLTRNTERS